MSCSRIYNDYDGVQHDYIRKQGLIWQQVFLPDMAPAEWADREILWNAVEEAEKTKDSRLAREFVVALPVELSRDEWITLLTNFIQINFVADGMCADVCIHDTDGHNPHAHIMLTVRPLTKDGKWQHKTEKEYLCIRNGEERGFTAAEFNTSQGEGWEKQYQYKAGKKKVYMAPSAAEAQGLERVSKYPKSTKYGRQNPITACWNSEEQLVLWRAAWADAVNRCLERSGHEERVDHRSHAERGLDEQPTIHEGVVARALEKKGIISDRCELNRQIKADNALLRELKSLVKKLMDAVKNSVPAIAEAMETVRQKMIVFRYQLLHIGTGKKQIADTLRAVQPDIKRYEDVVKQLKAKIKERRVLLDEKKNTPAIQVFRHRELAQKIAGLTEDIEELILEQLRMNGLVNSDLEVIGHMDKEIVTKSDVIPVSMKDGLIQEHYSSVADSRHFEALKLYVRGKVKEDGQQILSGKVLAAPYKQGNQTACDYCLYHGVCGFDLKVSGYRFRRFPAMKPKEVWEQILEGEEEDEMDQKTEGGN